MGKLFEFTMSEFQYLEKDTYSNLCGGEQPPFLYRKCVR